MSSKKAEQKIKQIIQETSELRDRIAKEYVNSPRKEIGGKHYIHVEDEIIRKIYQKMGSMAEALWELKNEIQLP